VRRVESSRARHHDEISFLARRSVATRAGHEGTRGVRSLRGSLRTRRHPRPPAAGTNGYDPTATAGTNLGPTSAKLINGTTKTDDKTKQEAVDFDGIKDRIVHYCLDNDIPLETSMPLDRFKDAKGELDDVKLIKAFNDEKSPLEVRAKDALPADAVTASASGVDPHISPRNAELQAGRVAKARGVSVEQVRALVAAHTEGRTWGILEEPHVNVLELNLALDQQFVRK